MTLPKKRREQVYGWIDIMKKRYFLVLILISLLFSGIIIGVFLKILIKVMI